MRFVQIAEGLKTLIDRGVVQPRPIRPLAHLLHGATLEAAMYIATARDPGEARAEIGENLRALLEGLRRGEGW